MTKTIIYIILAALALLAIAAINTDQEISGYNGTVTFKDGKEVRYDGIKIDNTPDE